MTHGSASHAAQERTLQEHASREQETRSSARSSPGPGITDSGIWRSFAEGFPEPLYVAGRDGSLVSGNPPLLRLLQAGSVDELRALAPERLYPEPGQLQEKHRLLEECGSLVDFELRLRTASGAVHTVRDTCWAHRDDDGALVAAVGILREASRRSAGLGFRPDTAMLDDDGVACRAECLDDLRQHLEGRRVAWACLRFELHFSPQRDVESRKKLVREFHHFIRRHTRQDGVLVRLRPGELAMMLPVASACDAEVVAQRLVRAATHEAPVGFGLGVANRRPAETVDSVLERACRARYTFAPLQEV